MPAKKKTVTDATKAKLPLPKGHPQKRQAKRKRCPSCEKMVSGVHTCYDAKALREETPSPIAGQPLPANPPTEDAPTFEAVPCVDWLTGVKWGYDIPSVTTSTAGYREPLYDTRPIPWSWETPTLSIRRWLSKKLTALAKWVAP